MLFESVPAKQSIRRKPIPVDVTIRIAGQAGQGVQSISAIIGKIFTRHGL